MGSSSAISTSKIRKITARRKNRSENGIRAEFFGSNPHSNGVVLLGRVGIRIETVNIRSARAIAIKVAMRMRRANFIIKLVSKR